MVLVALIAFVGHGGRSSMPPAKGAPPAAAGALSVVPDVVADVEPSVVTILVGDGLGSGIVYRSNGVIVTNQHVVASATDGAVEVAFADGRRVPGKVQAADAVSDIAVVKVERTGLPAAKFRKQQPRLGELAIAIGSPLGLENSVTAGIISGLNRTLPDADGQGGPGGEGGQGGSGGQAAAAGPRVDLIQTDAAISPGNSGGPLLDAEGRVVGVTEAYLPPQTGAVSLGFAIPSATVVDAVDQLLRTGAVRHAFVGIQSVTLTPQIADQLGLAVRSGALVLGVVRGGPADRAGIRPGDVIRSFDGRAVISVEDFSAELRSVDPGQTVTLTVNRDGENVKVKVTVTDRPT
ncbi:S1C family serine protease [Frankia sp. QA3]|uniref:S1C family serine protease n=1 Tax=Frankia sp. QA3 TaxID=710111 RepID=UPI000269BEAD|nr:trypsin-like serine protease with C-terminal PDZ domain [Frankia sp. QA3]